MKILNEAETYARNDNRETIELSDVRITIDLLRLDEKNQLITLQDLKEIAQECNCKPLPELKEIDGLPISTQNEFCLNKTNFRLKSNKQVSFFFIFKIKRILFFKRFTFIRSHHCLNYRNRTLSAP